MFVEEGSLDCRLVLGHQKTRVRHRQVWILEIDIAAVLGDCRYVEAVLVVTASFSLVQVQDVLEVHGNLLALFFNHYAVGGRRALES